MTSPPRVEATARPATPGELFVTYCGISLQAFGGSLALTERTLVQHKRWFTPQEFLGQYAICQVLPGPTGLSLCVLVGDRFFGLRGALAAMGGFLLLPAAIVIALAALFVQFQHLPAVQGALNGMGGCRGGPDHPHGSAPIAHVAGAVGGHPRGCRHLRGGGAGRAFGAHRDAQPGSGLGGLGLASAGASAMTSGLPASELLALFGHFLSLSVFATGGVMALASDMHRYVVDEHHYVSHAQFVGSIALGQAAPGPNLMWVVVLGWLISGLPGALATTLGLALPALVFPVLVSRASRLPQFDRGLAALQRGLGPVAVGLMAATCTLLVREAPGAWKGAAMIAVSLLVLLGLKKLPPVVLIMAAGIVGAFVPW